MISNNISFLRKSLNEGNPEYGILSLTADSLDALRTYMSEERLNHADQIAFRAAMEKILEGMTTLDEIISG